MSPVLLLPSARTLTSSPSTLASSINGSTSTHSGILRNSLASTSGSTAASSIIPSPAPKRARFKLPSESTVSSPASSATPTPSPTLTITPSTYFPSSKMVTSPSRIGQQKLSPFPSIESLFEKQDISSPSKYTRVQPSVALAKGPDSEEYAQWRARLEHRFYKRPSWEIGKEEEEAADRLRKQRSWTWSQGSRYSSGSSRSSTLKSDLSIHTPTSAPQDHSTDETNQLGREEYVFGGKKERRDRILPTDPEHAQWMRDGAAALDKSFAEEAAREARTRSLWRFPTSISFADRIASRSATGSSGSPKDRTRDRSMDSERFSTSSSTGFTSSPSTLSRSLSRTRSNSNALLSLFASRSASANLESEVIDSSSDYGDDGEYSDCDNLYEGGLRSSLSTLTVRLHRMRSRNSCSGGSSRRRRRTSSQSDAEDDSSSFIVNSVVNANSLSRARAQSALQNNTNYLSSSTSFPTYRSRAHPNSLSTPAFTHSLQEVDEELGEMTRRPFTRKEDMYHLWIGFEQGWILRLHRLKKRVRGLSLNSGNRNDAAATDGSSSSAST